MTQENDVTLLEAFELMGQALLRLAADKADAVCETGVLRVMRALAASTEAGSSCAVLAPGELTDDEVDALQAARLAVHMTESVGNLNPDARADEEAVNAPIVLDGPLADGAWRVYMQRQFADEMVLAWLMKRYASEPKGEVTKTQTERLATIKEHQWLDYGQGRISREQFEANRKGQDDAVMSALENRFAIICGGPGTGKTTTVVRILAGLFVRERGLRVALAAPTGKAASRMMQSIRASLDALPDAVVGEIREAIDDGRLCERTIHKWLETKQEGGAKPDAANPLQADVLIVDEASMIDMGLAVRLFRVLDPKRTRVIVLGDKYQLAAVGPGSVFADMCAPDGALAAHVARLTVSHRFKADSCIGRLAAAVNNVHGQDAEAQWRAVEALFDAGTQGRDRVAWHRVKGDAYGLTPSLTQWLDTAFDDYFTRLARLLGNRPATFEAYEAAVKDLWDALNASRALAAQRRGPMSVERVNAYQLERLIERLNALAIKASIKDALLPGLVVIVRQNNDVLGVYNGDVAVLVPAFETGDASEGALVAYFGDSGKTLPAALLPQHDTAFAMTIHQSQGSEYKHVAVLMPGDAASGLATRELLYTGITRAKESVHVFAKEDVLRRALTTATRRDGGLAERLTTVRVDP